MLSLGIKTFLRGVLFKKKQKKKKKKKKKKHCNWQHMFWAEIRKIIYTRVNPSFTRPKWGLRGSKSYRHVYVMFRKMPSGMINSVDPDQTAPEEETICLHMLFCQKHLCIILGHFTIIRKHLGLPKAGVNSWMVLISSGRNFTVNGK